MGQDRGLHTHSTAEDLDTKRHETSAYEYLCHLEEAKTWISDCIKEHLPPATELEENLRNGVYFAKIAHFCAPHLVPEDRIFDREQTRWREQGLHFKHTDNINFFLQAARQIGLPEIFLPETTDIYDRKNMPRAIFCIHALSLFMFKLGNAPKILDLYGRAQFTEAEISIMQEELNRTGVELPQFKKLGGMLGNDGSDSRRMEELFEEITDLVMERNEEGLRRALTNPLAKLNGVMPHNMRQYMVVMSSECRELCRPLSQPEVQGLITRVNLLLCLESVLSAVREEDTQALLLALRSKPLGVSHLIKDENAEMYLTNLLDYADGLAENVVLKKDMIMSAVASANQLENEKDSLEHAIRAVNQALRQPDSRDIISALRQPELRLQDIITAAENLYFTELGLIQRESGCDLNYEGICSPVVFLNQVAQVGLAAIRGDTTGVHRELANPELAILDLKPECEVRYGEAVVEFARQQGRVPSHTELQDLVDRVNHTRAEDYRRVEGVERVNLAVEKNGVGLGEALAFLNISLNPRDEPRCLMELRNLQANRSCLEGEEMGVWWEDITEAVSTTEALAAEAVSVAGALRGLNSAVQYRDVTGVMSYLTNNWELLGLERRPERKRGEDILKALERRVLGKKGGRGEGGHTWVPHFFYDGTKVWIEVEGGRIAWSEPEIARRDPARVLAVEEVAEGVAEVEGGGARQLEKIVTLLQARSRGFLIRRKLFDMLDWYDRHEREVVLVQSLWRGKRARREVVAKLQEKIKTRQSALQFIYGHGDIRRLTKHVVVIQRAWRARKLRAEWQKLMQSGRADLHTVVAHMHFLDIRVSDAREELELARARGELSKLMRQNDTLEQDLEEMDKKIGLLVQNRISVQDVIIDRRKGMTLSRGTLSRRTDSSSSSTSSSSHIGTHRGLKALKKESQDRLKAYQHLFYLLQTNPDYLARLMFTVPQPNTKFMETLIFTLYNFGGNQREEFLLIKLFRTALHREIATKVVKLDDVVRNTPMVLKLVVTYNRSGRGGYMLRQLLGPLIRQVLADDSLKINVNPVEVYKTWVNQTENDTGQAAGLPYDVTQEVALGYEEVQRRLEKSISSLKRMSTLFLATITGGLSKLPYGILYLSKVLYVSLREKFPEAQEKEILKVIGNLIYYKFINPAVIAPDRFDIVDKKPDSNLNNNQRRNLAYIAKILQYAASKKGFAEESPHLKSLNPYIIECHEKFKQFFMETCEVAEPEDQFSIDQYSEAALIAKPNIYISLSEICDTHQLLVDHRVTVAPGPGDPLHPLLSALGPPSLSSLLGAAEGECSSLSSLGKTEVCLVLSPAPGSSKGKDMSDTERLWVKTKHLLLAILPAVQYSEKQTLIGVLKSRTSPQQEKEYNKILDKKEEEGEASRHQDIEMVNIFCDEEGRLPLEDAKRLVLKNLRILEVAGYTSSKDNCQSIVTDIAKDILNQREHRINRRRELIRLKKTKAGLLNKKDYIQAQLEQYRQYVNHCLANMNRAGKHKQVHFSTLHDGEKGRKIRSKAALKYAATKLYDKGVLRAIEGLPPAQIKNVMFVFLPLESDGMFEISARFMGVDMERVIIDIQELLKLQYEGVAVTDMFGKAKINVNLLLHFLNAKFYGK